MNIHEELAKFNNVVYYDEPHKYFIGDRQLISGTAFIELFKKKFDKKKKALDYAKKNRINFEDVLEDWERKGEFARTKGTLLHAYAESYWQNKVFPDTSIEYDGKYGDLIMSERLGRCKELFHNFYNDAKENLIPVALELVIADSELGLSGMVDKLMWNKKAKEYQIWDYKTNKEIGMKSKYKEYMSPPINFLQVCEFNSYSIQLGLYKYLIQRNTNIKIGKCYLIHIHEEQDKYNVIECAEFNNVIELMINYYLKQINDGKTNNTKK